MSEYPVTTFRIDGDPAAIRASARGWSEFAEQAADAAAQIRGLDTSLFIGPEGDQYREGLSSKLPPHLTTTAEAYGGVASALTTFAASLDDLQDRMRPWTVRGPGLWADLTAAQRALESAKYADQAHLQQRLHQQTQLPLGQTLPTDSYHPATGSAAAGLTAAQQAWNHALTTAQGLKTDLAGAIETCVKAINDRAEMRFKANPSGFSAFVSGVKGFVKDHVAVLAKISSILKTVSMVAGFLALVPGLDFIAAPVALLAGAGALAIDATTMWATGNWNAETLALDTVAVIPGAKLAEGIAAGARAAGRVVSGAFEGTEIAAKIGQAADRITLTTRAATAAVKAATAAVKAATKSITTDIAEVRIGIAVTPDGIPTLLRTGKTTGEMLSTAKDEAKTAYNEVRNAEDATGGVPVHDSGDPLSYNQMNKAIQRGQAPKGIYRIDRGKVPGAEQPHAAFGKGQGAPSLNIDGTWKHGYVDLTKLQTEWLRSNGWNI